jgi:SAM-dependent methyltransferase
LHKETTSRDFRLYPRLTDPDFLLLTSLREAIRLHAKHCQGVIVDYGCGEKPYMPLFPGAARYVGVDFCVNGPNDVRLRPDGGLPLDNDFADVVVSFQVLEHVPDVSFYLSECFRVLRPGGQLLLSTHGIWPYHPGPNYDDFWRWTSSGLRRVMQGRGFRILGTTSVCSRWYSVLQNILAVGVPGRIRPAWIRDLLQFFLKISVNFMGLAMLRVVDPNVSHKYEMPVAYLFRARK